MTRSLVDRIADAVLYEGYLLYPYRPSIKNHQRWTFGGLFPEEYCRVAKNGDVSSNRTECPLRGTPETHVTIRTRFLHLTNRRVGMLDTPLAEWTEGAAGTLRFVPSLQASDTIHHCWQEAEEREVILGPISLKSILNQSRRQTFTFPQSRRVEPLRDTTDRFTGVLIREQESISGAINVSAFEFESDLYRLSVQVSCCSTENRPVSTLTRDDAALRSLLSTHTILNIQSGSFVSLVDPPEWGRQAAESCRNVGTWPVMVGDSGDTETMLSAPIILPDYPRIAPESPGDYFDGTEMDEMLTLRILTMTDDEKMSMSSIDQRAHALLARTQSLEGDDRMGMHGVLRAGWETKEGADVRPRTGE